MRDNQKTKAELLKEVETLRRRVAELKQAKDVTKHKKVEEQLKETKERLEYILSTTPQQLIRVKLVIIGQLRLSVRMSGINLAMSRASF